MSTTFHGLHSLRGLAAVAVLLFHAKAVFGIQLAPSGYLAVDLFFILSGFVIAHSYDPRFEAGLSARTFIIARAARFWPLFALGTGFGAAWLVLENIASPPAALSISEVLGFSALALAYVPAPVAGDLVPLNVPAWSLFFELIVNAGFALFFSVSKTRWLPGVLRCQPRFSRSFWRSSYSKSKCGAVFVPSTAFHWAYCFIAADGRPLGCRHGL